MPLPSSKTDYSRQRQVTSYDYNTAPWADVADREFALMEKDDYVAGEFVWSGVDYLGEPTPFDNEARSSYFGAVDLTGIAAHGRDQHAVAHRFVGRQIFLAEVQPLRAAAAHQETWDRCLHAVYGTARLQRTATLVK